MTTSADSAVHAEALQAGANKVVVKPDNTTELMAIAKEIVELGRAARKPRGGPSQR